MAGYEFRVMLNNFQDLPKVPNVNYAEFYLQFVSKMQANVSMQSDLLKAFQLQAGV